MTEESMTVLNQRWATVPLHLVSEFITKLSFNILVQYKFVSTSEAYNIAKIILSPHLMFLIFTN